MVEWRPLIVSIFFAVAIYLIQLLLAAQNDSYLAVLLGAVAVGYMIDGTIKDGVIHGAILGLILGLIVIVVLIIQIAGYGLLGALGGSILQSVLLLVVVQIVIGLIGGVLGALFNSESLISVEDMKN